MRAWFEDIDIQQTFRIAGMKFKKISENTAQRIDKPDATVVYWRLTKTQDIVVTD